MSKVRTVWILGAGFSRSLGGPLLDDLLSMRSWSRFCAQDPKWEEDEDLNQTYALYHYGRGFPEGYIFHPDGVGLVGQKFWRSAEEFLEFLNSGSESDLKHREMLLSKMQASLVPQLQRCQAGRLPGVLRDEVSIANLSMAALRIIARECDFVPIREAKEHLKWERARPYLAWGSSLNGNDHILSFNYDLVIEGLASQTAIIHGVADERFSDSAQERRSAGAPTLYKMHGSLDWESVDGGYRRVPLTEVSEPAIATPGNAKLEMKEGGFKSIWEEAERQIRAAERIIWIGYSLPASDASAVESILTALSENTCEDLEVEVVMGPPSDDASRVKALLDRAIGAKVDPKLKKKTVDAKERLEKRKERLLREQKKREQEPVIGSRRLGGIEAMQSLFEARDIPPGMMAALAGVEPPTFDFSDQVRILSMYAQDFLRTHAVDYLRGFDEQQLAVELEGLERAIDRVDKNIEALGRWK